MLVLFCHRHHEAEVAEDEAVLLLGHLVLQLGLPPQVGAAGDLELRRLRLKAGQLGPRILDGEADCLLVRAREQRIVRNLADVEGEEIPLLGCL